MAFQNSVIYQSYVTETNLRKHKHCTNKFKYFFLSYFSQEIRRRSKGGAVYEHDATCFQIIAEVQREFNRKSQQR